MGLLDGNEMKDLILGARILVIFLSASGYLFGQLFFGEFTWYATISGIFGVLAGSLSGKFISSRKESAYSVLVFCVVAIIGVVFDAYNYYEYLDIPGNDFGWYLKVPYIASLILIGWHCYQEPTNKSLKERDALKRAP